MRDKSVRSWEGGLGQLGAVIREGHRKGNRINQKQNMSRTGVDR